MKKLIIVLIFLILALTACSFGEVDGRTAYEWRDIYEETYDDLNRYEEALEMANSNIDEAKGYAWSSYEDMGYALDALDTVEP